MHNPCAPEQCRGHKVGEHDPQDGPLQGVEGMKWLVTVGSDSLVVEWDGDNWTDLIDEIVSWDVGNTMDYYDMADDYDVAVAKGRVPELFSITDYAHSMGYNYSYTYDCFLDVSELHITPVPPNAKLGPFHGPGPKMMRYMGVRR